MNKLSRIIKDFSNGSYPFKKPVEVIIQFPLGSSYGELKARRVIKKKLASLLNGSSYIVREHSIGVKCAHTYVNQEYKERNFNKRVILRVTVETSEVE